MATYALVDGGVSTVEYLWKNGIRPAHFLFTLKDLEESIAYCDPEEDVVLLIVSGCTELAYTTVKEAVELISSSENIKSYGIFSNIPINTRRVSCDYIFFDGDLMNGTEYAANTAVYFNTPTVLKPIKGDRQITKFRVAEATEADVDIGEIPVRNYPVYTDAVKPEEVYRINIFEKKHMTAKE